MVSQAGLDDGEKKRVKNIVSSESKNKHYEEKKESCEVKNSAVSVMAKETQEESCDSIDHQVIFPSYPLNSNFSQDEFLLYSRMMEANGLRFELSVTSMLRATKFKPFQKKLYTPINFGSTLHTGPHMRGYWFATLSLFLATVGWFSITPMMIHIREEIGICDNQENIGDGKTQCICADVCKRTIDYLKVISLISSTIMVLLAGGLIEKFGPKNVQCALLFLGAFFIASVSLIQNVTGLIIVDLLVSTLGAGFLTSLFWISLLFDSQIFGIVSGTALGWGSLGGLIANMVMPPLERWTKNWRTAFLIPAAIMLLFSIIMYFLSQDTPIGRIKVQRDLKKDRVLLRDYLKCILDYRVCILSIQYGASFGAEITMNSELAPHFHDYFGLSLMLSGWLLSGYVGMNIFARCLGGYFSDYMHLRMGVRGRLWAQFVFLCCGGISLLTFGYMETEQGYLKAFIVMLFF